LRIDLLTRFSKHYTYETYAAKELEHAFRNLNIQCKRHMLSEGYFGNYLGEISNCSPDLVLYFEMVFPDEKPLSNLLDVPCLFWPRVCFSDMLSFRESPLTWIGGSDRRWHTAIKKSGFNQSLFLPHAHPTIAEDVKKEYFYDVVVFDSLIDPERLESMWKDFFYAEQLAFLHDLIDHCKKNSEMTTLESALYILEEKKIQTKNFFLHNIIFAVEEYFRSKKTLHFIESLENIRVDIFGEHIGNNWLKKLKNAHNIHLHWSLPHTEYFEVLKRSKILMRHPCPKTDGSDEWILSALIFGCHVISQGSGYLDEEFSTLESYHKVSQSEDYHPYISYWLAEPQKTFLSPELFFKHSWTERAHSIVNFAKTAKIVGSE
jgi:spore maturation protein CgeB